MSPRARWGLDRSNVNFELALGLRHTALVDSTWQYIRLLRAHRPPLVGDDRADVFSSALEQSEQLMRAAEAVGPAARPLPLFYSLSQAGRAIAAARLPDDQWRLSGHGVSVRSLPGQADLLRRTVVPDRLGKKAIEDGRRSSFAGVAEAVVSGQLTGPVELGAVWCALPDLIPPITPQMPALDPGWRRPLVVFDFYWDHGEQALSGMFGTELIVCGLTPGATAQQLQEELSHYPAAAGALVRTNAHLGPVGTASAVIMATTPEGRDCPRITWPEPRELHPRLDDIAPFNHRVGARMLLPSLADRDAPSALMLWWILLLGLSSIARYDPELWVAALDLNRPTAVPIEVALDRAIAAVPSLVLEALAP